MFDLNLGISVPSCAAAKEPARRHGYFHCLVVALIVVWNVERKRGVGSSLCSSIRPPVYHMRLCCYCILSAARLKVPLFFLRLITRLFTQVNTCESMWWLAAGYWRGLVSTDVRSLEQNLVVHFHVGGARSSKERCSSETSASSATCALASIVNSASIARETCHLSHDYFTVLSRLLVASWWLLCSNLRPRCRSSIYSRSRILSSSEFDVGPAGILPSKSSSRLCAREHESHLLN